MKEEVERALPGVKTIPMMEKKETVKKKALLERERWGGGGGGGEGERESEQRVLCVKFLSLI